MMHNAEGLTAEAQAATNAARNYEMLGVAMKGVGVSIMALGAGWIIGSGFNDQMAKVKTTIDEAEAHWLEQKRAVDQKQMDSDANVINKKIASALNASTDQSTVYNNQLVAAQEEGQAEIRANDDKLRQMLDAHKGYLAQIVSAEKESESEIEQGRLRIMALQEKGKDNQFKNSLDKLAYDPQKQVSALESHAQTLIREAERVMAEGAKLGDKAEIQRGRQIFQEAEAANKQAEAIASSEVEKGMQGKSPEDIKYAESFDPRVTSAQGYTQSTIDAQIRAEERINALERQRIRTWATSAIINRHRLPKSRNKSQSRSRIRPCWTSKATRCQRPNWHECRASGMQRSTFWANCSLTSRIRPTPTDSV